MQNREVSPGFFLVSLVIFALSFSLGCSIHVKKDEQGQDKKVDIDTPVGNIHVSKDADPRDTELPIYPGARPKKEENKDDVKSANVNISSGLFGVRVVAVEYVSDAPPEKVISYYRNQLKRFGQILECHSSASGGRVQIEKSTGSNELKCDDNDHGNTVELKVGTKDNQHIVSVTPDGQKSSFALVYVKTRGKDTI